MLLEGFNTNRHLISGHLHEAASDFHFKRFIAQTGHRTFTERGDDGSVSSQHFKAPLGTRKFHAIGFAFEYRLFGRYDSYFHTFSFMECKCGGPVSTASPAFRQACAISFLPLAMASSMVPTLRKACSGRSSTSPSRIMLKPRMTSSIGTITPGTPVNFSATVNG